LDERIIPTTQNREFGAKAVEFGAKSVNDLLMEQWSQW